MRRLNHILLAKLAQSSVHRAWICSLLASFPMLRGDDPDWTLQLSAGPPSEGDTSMVVGEDGCSYLAWNVLTNGGWDIFSVALDADGNELWSRSYDHVQRHDQAYGITLQDGRLMITGESRGPTGSTVLLLEYEARTGNPVHAVHYSSGDETSGLGLAGEALFERGEYVEVDEHGTIYVGGRTVGNDSDILMLRFDESLALEWARSWDGGGAPPLDYPRGMRLDPSGNVLMLVSSWQSTPDYAVLKYAPDGDLSWSATWGWLDDQGRPVGPESPWEMEVDALGDVYVTGTGSPDPGSVAVGYSTIKLWGSDGKLAWSEATYDAPGWKNVARGLALDGQGRLFITGAMRPKAGNGHVCTKNYDIYTVARSTSDGALLWEHTWGEPASGCLEIPTDIFADNAGHVFIAGRSPCPSSVLSDGSAVLLALDGADGTQTHGPLFWLGSSTDRQRVGFEILGLDSMSRLFVAGRVHGLGSGVEEPLMARYSGF